MAKACFLKNPSSRDALYPLPSAFLTCGIKPPSFKMARTSLGRAGKG
jgi:hypothetical protein